MRQIYTNSSDKEVIDAVDDAMRKELRFDTTHAELVMERVKQWNAKAILYAKLDDTIAALESQIARAREQADQAIECLRGFQECPYCGAPVVNKPGGMCPACGLEKDYL